MSSGYLCWCSCMLAGDGRAPGGIAPYNEPWAAGIDVKFPCLPSLPLLKEVLDVYYKPMQAWVAHRQQVLQAPHAALQRGQLRRLRGRVARRTRAPLAHRLQLRALPLQHAPA